MTLPHLMNCEHTGTGWCLSCVSLLYLKSEYRQQTVSQQLEDLEKMRGEINSLRSRLSKYEIDLSQKVRT
jgi:cell shape-determining protein MreC